MKEALTRQQYVKKLAEKFNERMKFLISQTGALINKDVQKKIDENQEQSKIYYEDILKELSLHELREFFIWMDKPFQMKKFDQLTPIEIIELSEYQSTKYNHLYINIIDYGINQIKQLVLLQQLYDVPGFNNFNNNSGNNDKGNLH